MFVFKNIRLSMLLLFVVVFICLLGNYFKMVVTTHHTDTAFLLELTENTRVNGEPVSSILNSTIDAGRTWDQPAMEVCSSALIPTNSLYNILNNHAHYALFALSELTRFFSAETVLSYLNAFSFISILLITYLFLRKNKVSIFCAAFFCFIISLHPAWAFAATGDFYVDRFCMPLILAYLMGMHALNCRSNTRLNLWAWRGVILIGVIGAAMTERAAIMMGFATFSILFMFWGQPGLNRRCRIVLTVLGGLFLTYALWYIKFRFNGALDAGVGTLVDLPHILFGVIDRYKVPASQKQLSIFLITNIGFLGLFSFFSGWRTIVIMLIALLPNIIVTTGGAEHTGWSTHYHSMYFPFVIYCSTIGLINLNKNKGMGKYKFIRCIPFVIPIIFTWIFNPYDGSLHLPSKANLQAGITNQVWQYYVDPLSSPTIPTLKLVSGYNAAIPYGSKVSTMEGVMISIYRKATIYYYPIGIDSADYVILQKITHPDGSFYYAGAVNYLGEAQQLDKCLNERLIKAGYKLDQPYLELGNNMVILKRYDVKIG